MNLHLCIYSFSPYAAVEWYPSVKSVQNHFSLSCGFLPVRSVRRKLYKSHLPEAALVLAVARDIVGLWRAKMLQHEVW